MYSCSANFSYLAVLSLEHSSFFSSCGSDEICSAKCFRVLLCLMSPVISMLVFLMFRFCSLCLQLLCSVNFCLILGCHCPHLGALQRSTAKMTHM